MINPEISAVYDSLTPLENQNGKNDRFAYARATKGPHEYFVKTAIRPDMQSHIQRELVWYEFMRRVEAFYPDRHFRGMRVERRIGRDTLVYDYVDAPVVAAAGEPDQWRMSMPRYALMLETFDSVAMGWKSEDLPDEPSRSVDTYGIWLEWLGDNADKVKYLPAARKYVDLTKWTLKHMMQHGDLSPWQVFVQGEDWIVYDGERCGTDLFRFYDLAYGFTRLYATLHAPDAAAELLRQFLAVHTSESRDDFIRQFMPVLTHRTIGVIADAYHDQATNDYLHEATELLNLCLGKKFDELIS
ncbi:MAG: hypothetical protein WAT17_01790 [Candidatus Saccharimonadales bacterium]|jgi:hypothetical protein